jgi:hypothetical protein
MSLRVSRCTSAVPDDNLRWDHMLSTASSGLRLVLPLAFCLAGCGGEALAPGTLAGTFELRSVGARPLPAVYDSSGYGFGSAVRGSFTFTDDGHVLWSWDERLLFRPTLEEPFQESTYSYETVLPYTLHGAELKIGDDCLPDPLGNCAPPMLGRVAGARLTLSPVFSRDVWAFVRTGP